MLRVFQHNINKEDIKVNENDMENYTDITSINSWICMVDSYNYNESDATEQIKLWVSYHKTKNLETYESPIIEYFHQLITEAVDSNFVIPR